MPSDAHDEAKAAHLDAVEAQRLTYITWLKCQIVLLGYVRNFAEMDQVMSALHEKAGQFADEVKLPRVVETLTYMKDQKALPKLDKAGMKKAAEEIEALVEQHRNEVGAMLEDKNTFTWEEIEKEIFRRTDSGDIDA